MCIATTEDWSGTVTNNNININSANGQNNGSNVMTPNNSCSSDGGMSNSIVGGCNIGIGAINNNETSPKSSSGQHMHHHSSATAFSAAAGFWSAAYQGKKT